MTTIRTSKLSASAYQPTVRKKLSASAYQPTVKIHKQLLLASKLSSEFGRVTTSMYSACDVATNLLMKVVYRDMSIPAKVVFWDLVAEHFTV